MIIVFEGINSCGKSTQIELLSQWLSDICGYNVVKTEWNSFQGLQGFCNSLKEDQDISNISLSLAQALDLHLRYDKYLAPFIHDDKSIILMDRYIYTTYARDLPRGISKEFICKLYSFMPEPDVVFFLDAPIETLMLRTEASGRKRSRYILGADLTFSEDSRENTCIFFEKQRNIYLDFINESNNRFVSINALDTIDNQHEQIKMHLKAFT